MQNFEDYVFLPSEDDSYFQGEVRKFIKREILPLAKKGLYEHFFPSNLKIPSLAREIYWQAFEVFRKQGYTALGIPEELGGWPCSAKQFAIFGEEMCRVDGGIGLSVGATLSLVAPPILMFGTKEQKELWIPQIISGEKFVGCYCQTEPEAGSNVANIKMKAGKNGDVWNLCGNKIFISNGSEASLAIVIARTNDHPYKGLTAFIVDLKKEKGNGRVKVKNEIKVGLHLSPTTQMDFDNAEAQILGGEQMLNQGWEVLNAVLAASRGVVLPAQGIGIALGALEIAKNHTVERVIFGKKLVEFPRINQYLSRMELLIEIGRLLNWRACFYKESSPKDYASWSTEASAAKLFCGEIAEIVPSLAIQIAGGYGYVEDLGIAKFWRDGRVVKIYEGTSEIQELIIAGGMANRAKAVMPKNPIGKFIWAAKEPWIFSFSEEEKKFHDCVFSNNVLKNFRGPIADFWWLRKNFVSMFFEAAQRIQPTKEERKSNMLHPFWHDLARTLTVIEGVKLLLWKNVWQAKNNLPEKNQKEKIGRGLILVREELAKNKIALEEILKS